MLKLVQMEALKDRRTSQISGGQQQRVALARALAPQPKVLLLDEPLSALDYKLRKEMQIELKRLQHETGITFIFVTHDQEEALTMSDRIAVMSAGKILQVGTPARHLRPAGRTLRRRLHRRDQFPARPSDRRRPTAARRVKLASGAELSAPLPEGFSPDGKVTVVVRPEHARPVPEPTGGTLVGHARRMSSISAPTRTIMCALDGGGEFIVRQQNSARRRRGFAARRPCRHRDRATTPRRC